MIACGGFIAKYNRQIDILCINSSGIKHEYDKLSAEEIAEVRCNEFKSVMKFAGIKNYDIIKIFGIPPMINQIEKNFKHYNSKFDFKAYDIILVSHKDDNHVEHKYVGNVLLKKCLKTSGYKKGLKIMRYELWSPMNSSNYYEDITDYINKKEELINLYASQSRSHYAERILALNKYRTLSSYFLNPEKFVEAFYVESVNEYLGKYNFKKLFSITNEYKNGDKRKVITILGKRIKLKTIK